MERKVVVEGVVLHVHMRDVVPVPQCSVSLELEAGDMAEGEEVRRGNSDSVVKGCAVAPAVATFSQFVFYL